MMIEPVIRGLTDLGRKVVAGIGMNSGQLIGRIEEAINGSCGGEAIENARVGKIIVVHGSVDEDGAGRDGGEDFSEIKRHLFRIP